MGSNTFSSNLYGSGSGNNNGGSAGMGSSGGTGGSGSGAGSSDVFGNVDAVVKFVLEGHRYLLKIKSIFYVFYTGKCQ